MTPVTDPYLLPSILHYLPPKEIGKCRRVCRLWREAIDANFKESITQAARAKRKESVADTVISLTYDYNRYLQAVTGDPFRPDPHVEREFREETYALPLQDLEARERLLKRNVDAVREQAKRNCACRATACFFASLAVGLIAFCIITTISLSKAHHTK